MWISNGTIRRVEYSHLVLTMFRLERLDKSWILCHLFIAWRFLVVLFHFKFIYWYSSDFDWWDDHLVSSYFLSPDVFLFDISFLKCNISLWPFDLASCLVHNCYVTENTKIRVIGIIDESCWCEAPCCKMMIVCSFLKESFAESLIIRRDRVASK